MSDPERYHTTFQVARLLAVSPATVVHWADEGRLPCHRTPGGHRRVADSAVRAFALKHGLPLGRLGRDEQRTLLVVDDDPDWLATIGALLERKGGYAVHRAASGFEAGVSFERHRPDAVIVDVRMEGLDGFAVTEALRRSGARTPVIGCTAYADPATWSRMQATFDAAFEKPLDLGALLSTLGALVHGTLRGRRARE